MSEVQTKIDAIMEQAQVFASAWSLVGGMFDNGQMLDEANEAKAELRQLVMASLTASIEQQAAQQDADRWRAFAAGAAFPKLVFNNGNTYWQYGEHRALSADAIADLVISARASNGGKA